MPTYEVLQVLVFLIPGFLSAAVLDALVVRRKDPGALQVVDWPRSVGHFFRRPVAASRARPG